MILNWKSFKIDLESFNEFLKNNVSSADGIVTDINSFTIVEKVSFTQDDTNNVNIYYNSLTEQGEFNKLNTIEQDKLIQAINRLEDNAGLSRTEN